MKMQGFDRAHGDSISQWLAIALDRETGLARSFIDGYLASTRFTWAPTPTAWDRLRSWWPAAKEAINQIEEIWK